MAGTPPLDFVLSVFGAPRFTGADRAGREPTLTQRRLLERLALTPSAPVSLDQLIEAVWEAEPPVHARAAVHNQISRMRAQWGADVIVTTANGYALGVSTDTARLHELSVLAERLLAEGRAQEAFETADAIVPLWIGRPFTAIEHVAAVSSARRSLSASCKGAENTRLAAGIALGRMVWSVTEAERLAGESPLDEHRQALLARALAAAGRRGDALAALATARRVIRREVGVEPGGLLAAAEIEVRGAPPARSAPADLPFLGRQEQMRAALSLLSTDGFAQLVGEPGMGVTRLMQQISVQLTDLGVRVVQLGAGDHVDASDSVLREILDQLGRHTEATGPGIVVRFVPAVESAARTIPISILVDDAHLLGPTTRDILRTASEKPRLSVLFGSHPSGIPSDDAIRIPPLSLHDVAVTLRHVSREPDDHARAQELYRASGGNPLALALLVGMDITPDASSGLVALGHRLLAGLGRDDRDLVELVAIGGGDVTIPSGAVLPYLLEREPTGRTVFRHGALRSLVARELSPARREELHLQVARKAQASGATASAVAHHLVAAGALGTDAVEACRRAAAHAAQQGAHADAAAWLEHAVVRAGESESLDIRIAWGDELRLAGDPRHLEILLACARDAIDTADEGRAAEALHALLQLGATSTSGSRLDEIDVLLERGLAVITEAGRRARVCAAASLSWSLAGNAGQSRALFREALALAADDGQRAAVLPFAYMALGMPDDVVERECHARELLDLGRRLRAADVQFEGWQLMASVHLMRGDLSGVRDCAVRMEELADGVGDIGRRWALLFTQSAIAHLEGRMADAVELNDRAHVLFAPVSPTRAAAVRFGQVLGLHLAHGDLASLAPALQSLVATQPGVPAWHAALALASVRDDPGGSRHHAGLAIARAQPDVTWLATHAVGARAAAQLNDESLMNEYLEALTPHVGRAVWQGSCSYGPVDTAIAMLLSALGRKDDAQDASERAVHVAERLGSAVFAAEARAIGRHQ